MIRKIATIAAVAGAALTFTVSAYAMDFPATPMNSGVPVLPGEGMIPGLRESMMVVNGVTQPILQPILVPGGAAPMAEGGMKPMHHRHHYHHMMMKKKMMKKKMM